MRRKLLASLLALQLAGFAHGAGKTSAPAPAPATPEDLTARTVFQVLLGEMSLQRGNVELGVSAYADLAQRTRDPRVVERATEIAAFARQFDLALDLSKLWVELEPTSQKARQTLITILALMNRLDELGPQAAILLEQDKSNLGDHLLRLNRMLARHSDRQAVQRLVDQVAKPYVGIAEAHYAMATAAASANDTSRAEAEIAKALELRPDWEAAALLRAQIQASRSQTEAIGSLNEFVARNPGARDARLTLARVLIAEKRYDEARQHFQHLLREAPDNPELVYPLAMLALQHNDLATGKVYLEKLLEVDFPDKSTVHFFLGQIEEDQKHNEAALAHYQQVSAGDQFIPARGRAAQLLVREGRVEEARRLIHDTRGRTAEEQTQLVIAEAQLLREAKRYDDAFKLLEGALAKQPDNTDLLYDAALMAERVGRLDIMETRLQHLLKIKPDHAHGLNALGYSWADRNIRLPEAYELVSRALALTPEDPFIMDSLGWVLYRQGKLDEALKTLTHAYGKKADPEIAAHLSEVLWTMGRKDDARQLLREAAGKDPDNEVLTAAIKKLLP